MIGDQQLKKLIFCLKELRLVHNQSEFSEIIGISTGYMSQLLSGNRDVSKKIVNKIHDKFPVINPAWLLTGEGEMLKTNTSQSTGAPLPSSNREDRLLAVIESQQRMMESQQETIKELTSSIKKEDAPRDGNATDVDAVG